MNDALLSRLQKLAANSGIAELEVETRAVHVTLSRKRPHLEGKQESRDSVIVKPASTSLRPADLKGVFLSLVAGIRLRALLKKLFKTGGASGV